LSKESDQADLVYMKHKVEDDGIFYYMTHYADWKALQRLGCNIRRLKAAIALLENVGEKIECIGCDEDE
jgi:hypothetical protein